MLRNRRIYFIPIMGFLALIIIGTILLSLPICNNKPIKIIDSFFLATSGICVNGFSTVIISEQFNFLGQLILAIITQIGGLGFMSFIVYLLSRRNKKVKISEIVLAGESINEKNYANVKKRIKKILRYTFFIEFIGATLLAVRFIPIYGVGRGLWLGIFHSITAFCNAGFDLFGSNSLMIFRNDAYVNIIFIALIILGGIGFFVLEDIVYCLKRKKLKRIQFQSKLVLSSTAVLVTISVITILIVEPSYNLMDSLFLSTTLRTAGFYTTTIRNCQGLTQIISIILMFIGGAPGSTSGGIRIVAFDILIITMIETLKNRKEVVIFYRKINTDLIRKAITIFMVSITVVFIAVIIMLQLDNVGTMNVVFTCVSAFSATGVPIIEISSLNLAGKIIIMILMFLGRIGLVPFLSIFLLDKKDNLDVEYVDGDLSI